MTGSSSRRSRSPPPEQGDMTDASRSTRLRRSSTSLVQGDITAPRRSTLLSRSSPSPPRAQGDITGPRRSACLSRSWSSPPQARGDITAPSSSSCHRPSSPSPAGTNPLDDDNLFGEILVRMSPQPPCRMRANNVSKRWKTTNDRDFLKRFRSHHRKPPLLGILTGHKYLEYLVNFIPIKIDGFKIPFRHFSLREDEAKNVSGWELVDCRHGFVLFEDLERREGVIWDPVVDTFENFPIPQEFQTPNINYRHWAVLCTDETEGHVNGCCHSSPRKVVLVAIYEHQGQEIIIAGVYSSGKWDSIIHKPGPLVHASMSVGCPSIRVGNTLNWLLTLSGGYYIQFDLRSQSVSVIHCEIGRPLFARLIHSEETDGGLALADLVFPLDGSPAALQIWEKNESGVATWELVKSIPLGNLPKLECMPKKWSSSIVCYAEDAHTIFMNLHRMVYMVDLKTKEVSFIYGGDPGCPYHAFTSSYCQDEAKNALP